jgi:hypothetical protein
MPPPTQTVHYPTSICDPNVRPWLEAHGIFARKPPIRSSDYRLVRSCPRTYYLSRRLGLVKAFQYSAALTRGSWVHLAFACILDDPTDRALTLEQAIAARCEELRGVCKQLGVSGEKTREMIAREELDARTSIAWFNAALQIPDGSGRTLAQRFAEDWVVVAQEPEIRHGDRLIQPDCLLKDKAGKLWIVDFKTTGMSTNARLQTCPLEFQTQHYFHTFLDKSRDEADFAGQYGISWPGEIGGVLHVAIRKPSIEFGMKDRPFTLDESPFKSGPRKGEPRNERIYTGEPDPYLYEQRCVDWYMGRGEYSHFEPERLTDPCVAISTTSAELLLAEDLKSEYHARLSFIRKYTSLQSYPSEFEIGDPVVQHGTPSPYLPFHMVEPGKWPELILAEGFLQRDRDTHTEIDNGGDA